MAIKFDLEKAYDRVNWEFLEAILSKIGLDAGLVRLIIFCLESATLRVLWNGEQLEGFKPTRGVRQGDPLAPYLFVLCMEVLGQQKQLSVHNQQWKPIKMTRNGQKVNTSKSKVFFSPNTPRAVQESLSAKFEVPAAEEFGQYLGMPILQKRVNQNYISTRGREGQEETGIVEDKPATKAGRRILIQSVTSTIPWYSMQTAKIPETTIKEIEKLNRNFLWGDLNGKKKIHPVAWKTVCKPKEVCGLGLRMLKQMNKALLAKFGWRMMKEKEALWARTLWSKYGSPLAEISPKPNVSYVWRSIRHTMDVLKEGCCVEAVDKSNGEDHAVEICWNGGGNKKFTVKSVYDMQETEQEHRDKAKWRRIWYLKGPQRDNILLWQIRHKKL